MKEYFWEFVAAWEPKASLLTSSRSCSTTHFVNLQTQYNNSYIPDKCDGDVTNWQKVWNYWNCTTKMWCLHLIKILLNWVAGKAIMSFFQSISKNMLYSICTISKQVVWIIFFMSCKLKSAEHAGYASVEVCQLMLGI